MEEIKEETFEGLTEPERCELNEILLNTQEQCQMMGQLIENQIKKRTS